MDSAKKQLADKAKSATNILVTVSRDPSVDQLAACIGLTLLFNKLDKHTAAVFSGQVPSTIEFLKPEDTLEKNTDSLRDFIIALDKNKADKLRYKVENDVVRIFITPYRTSISQADLEFSQGDFNVDLVVALGVSRQEDLDEAITMHGRILHDATVASINLGQEGGLGSINWHDQQASSLSELVTELAQALGGNLLDEQISTALLTGIVAETDRFSNDKTSSQTMSASAVLMNAGANQQLVAAKLEESGVAPTETAAKSVKNGGSSGDDGALDIDHEGPGIEPGNGSQPPAGPSRGPTLPPPADTPSNIPGLTFEPPRPPIGPANSGNSISPGARLMTEPPAMGGILNANTFTQPLEPTTDPLSLPAEEAPQMLSHSQTTAPPPIPVPAPPIPIPVPPPPAPAVPQASIPSTAVDAPHIAPSTDIPTAVINSEPTTPGQAASASKPNQTLSDLESAVHSPHLTGARDEVSRALNSGADNSLPKANQALNAQPLGDQLRPSASPPTPAPTGASPAMVNTNYTTPLPDEPVAAAADPEDRASGDPPPPVPPPIPFQFGSNNGPAM